MQLTALVAQLIESSRPERNWERRVAIDRQIAVLVKDEAFILPVADFISAWGIRASLRGATRQPRSGYPVLDELWLGVGQ